MPSIILKPSEPSTTNTKTGPASTFTGAVQLDLLHKNPSIQVAHVMFNPGARTFWHTHTDGQLLEVLAGSGWICDEGGEPRKLVTGDTVWCEAGTTHWHGADEKSFMVHLAVSHGKTVWGEEVSEEQLAMRK